MKGGAGRDRSGHRCLARMLVVAVVWIGGRDGWIVMISNGCPIDQFSLTHISATFALYSVTFTSCRHGWFLRSPCIDQRFGSNFSFPPLPASVLSSSPSPSPMSTTTTTKNDFIAIACNRHTDAAAWSRHDPHGIVAFGAHHMVALYDPLDPIHRGVQSTMPGHTGDVNCVRWLTRGSQEDNTQFQDIALISGSTDKTARIWRKSNEVRSMPPAQEASKRKP